MLQAIKQGWCYNAEMKESRNNITATWSWTTLKNQRSKEFFKSCFIMLFSKIFFCFLCSIAQCPQMSDGKIILCAYGKKKLKLHKFSCRKLVMPFRQFPTYFVDRVSRMWCANTWCPYASLRRLRNNYNTQFPCTVGSIPALHSGVYEVKFHTGTR
jgi:hypothetical protein